MSRRRKRWTTAEDRKLRLLWGLAALDVIASELGRTPLGVYDRARSIGLPCGVPEGGEYMCHAAERCGVKLPTLRNILRWARSRGMVAAEARTLSQPGRRRAHHHRWVEPEEADEAVALWSRSETVNQAAKRHGLAMMRLKRWLVAYGMQPPARTRVPWRILPEEADAAVAWRARTETLTRGALRVGVPRHELAAWLREAGLRPRGREWRVERAVIDRVVREHMRRAA